MAIVLPTVLLSEASAQKISSATPIWEEKGEKFPMGRGKKTRTGLEEREQSAGHQDYMLISHLDFRT